MNSFIPFREFHLLKALNEFDKTPFPLDFFLNTYFKKHKQLGSKDKLYIGDTIYDIIRWLGPLDFFCEEDSWKSRLECYRKIDFTALSKDLSLQNHVKVSFPEPYFDLLKTNFGEEKAIEIALISNTRAPTTIRVNAAKTTREHLLSLWQNKYELEPCSHSPYGIRFKQKVHLHSLDEFKAGFFEIQDEGSQQVASLVQVKPKDHFLDYCAGSGGKTLAIAPAMNGKGQIYLSDIRPSILEQAKKRLKRAGIQNSQIIFPGENKLEKLQNKMDWVLIDVPCSGSGTLRRNPDMKWKFRPETITSLRKEQREIFDKAISYVRKGGCLVYATCSLFQEENEEQVKWFLENYAVSLENTLSLLPEKDGRDGFFGAVLRKLG